MRDPTNKPLPTDTRRSRHLWHLGRLLTLAEEQDGQAAKMIEESALALAGAGKLDPARARRQYAQEQAAAAQRLSRQAEPELGDQAEPELGASEAQS